MVSGSLHIFGLNHRLYSSYEKSVVEGTIEYLKDETVGFDDYYPCRRSGLGDMLRVRKWLSLFAFMHNSVIKSNTKFTNLRRRKEFS